MYSSDFRLIVEHVELVVPGVRDDHLMVVIDGYTVWTLEAAV